jgi:hypothetical protein
MKKILSVFSTVFLIFFGITSASLVVQAYTDVNHDVEVTIVVKDAANSVTVIKDQVYGNKITAIASEDIPAGHNFAFWIVNDIVRKDLEFNTQFTVISNLQLTAVFEPADNSAHAVVFMDSNGKVIKTDFVTNGQSYSAFPNTDSYSKPQYVVSSNKWKEANGNVAVFDNITESKVYVLQYELDGTVPPILINGESYPYNNIVTLKTDLVDFTHWEENGVVVSYDSSYSFTALTNRTVVEKTGGVEEPLVTVVDVTGIREGYNSYLGQFYLPVGYELFETGFIASKINKTLLLDDPEVTVMQSNSIHPETNEFLRSIPEDSFTNIRAYAIVSDGVSTSIIYSNALEFKYTLTLFNASVKDNDTGVLVGGALQYQLKAGENVTVIADSKPEGTMFVGWDYNEANNRVGEPGAEEYSFTMPSETLTVIGVFANTDSIIFGSVSAGNSRTPITAGQVEGEVSPDPDLEGMNGYRLQFKANTLAGDVGYKVENFTSNQGFSTLRYGSQLVKTIIKNNHATLPISVEFYAIQYSTVASSGVVTIQPGEAKTVMFLAPIGFHNPSFGIAIREDLTGESTDFVVLDLVYQTADTYPSGDPQFSVAGGEYVRLVSRYPEQPDFPAGTGIRNDAYLPGPGVTNTYENATKATGIPFGGRRNVNNDYGITSIITRSTFFDFTKGGLPYISAKLANLPTFDPANPELVVYFRVTNTNANLGTFKFNIGNVENPHLDPNKVSYDLVIEGNTTRLIELIIPRAEADEVYFSIIKPINDNTGTPTNTSIIYDHNIMIQMFYNNVIGYTTPVYHVSAVNATGGGDFEVGSSTTVTATIPEGKVFKQWTVDGVVVSTDNPYTFEVIDNIKLTAEFVQLYNVSVVNGTGGGDYEMGSSATVTATVPEGKEFIGWTIDGVVVSTDNPYTFEVTDNIMLTAEIIDAGTEKFTLSLVGASIKGNSSGVLVGEELQYNMLAGQIILLVADPMPTGKMVIGWDITNSLGTTRVDVINEIEYGPYMMPSENVKITTIFEDVSGLGFPNEGMSYFRYRQDGYGVIQDGKFYDYDTDDKVLNEDSDVELNPDFVGLDGYRFTVKSNYNEGNQINNIASSNLSTETQGNQRIYVMFTNNHSTLDVTVELYVGSLSGSHATTGYVTIQPGETVKLYFDVDFVTANNSPFTFAVRQLDGISDSDVLLLDMVVAKANIISAP